MFGSNIVDLLRNPETPDGVLYDAILDEIGADVASVYVVSGDTGEYSDHRSWSVAAFLMEKEAEAFCARLNQWAKDADVYHTNTGLLRNRYELKNPDDPQVQIDYTGVQYFVEKIQLRLADMS